LIREARKSELEMGNMEVCPFNDLLNYECRLSGIDCDEQWPKDCPLRKGDVIVRLKNDYWRVLRKLWEKLAQELRDKK